jgi:hypothetical protein
MTSTAQYVGMTSAEATTKAKQAGFAIVAVEITGPQYLDCQYRQDRLTLKVENGVVVSAAIG